MVFISGADQAFLYDSTKDSGTYTKLTGSLNAISTLILAMSMAVGGFLQKESWSLVYLLTAVSQTIGLFLAFFITENRSEDVNVVGSAADATQSFSLRRLGLSIDTKILIAVVSLYWGIASIYILFAQKLFTNVGLSISQVGLVYALSAPVLAVASMSAHRMEQRFSTKLILL